jgi:hypothetical protein
MPSGKISVPDDYKSPDSSSVSGRGYGTSHGSRSVRSLLRRMPRFVWLTSSAVVLLAGSIVWHDRRPRWDLKLSYEASGPVRFVSKEWWTRPPVRNASSALPEISGRVYGVAVQPAGNGHQSRVWIVGTRGLLAYSEDDGECWTRFEYDKASGEFRKAALYPCSSTRRAGLVQSAPQAQQQTPQSPVLQKSPPQVQQQPPDKQSSVQSKATSAEPQPTNATQTVCHFHGQANQGASAWNHDDGCTIPKTNLLDAGYRQSDFHCCGGGATSPTTNADIPAGLEVRVTGVHYWSVSDPRLAGNRFLLHTYCGPEPPPGPGCSVDVEVIAHYRASQLPLGSVAPGAIASQPAPSQTIPARPPSTAPDLLAIDFPSADLATRLAAGTPDGIIVATGGQFWSISPTVPPQADDTPWIWSTISVGQVVEIGRGLVKWGSTASTPAETWHEGPWPLSPPGQVSRECPDCTIAWDELGDVPSSTAWAVGWTTDSSGVDHGVILRSADDGSTWIPVTRGGLPLNERDAAAKSRPWMWPPKWYLAVLFLSVLLAIPALLPPEDIEITGEPTGSVEGRLSSDKPLDPGDDDVLGLTSIALGLSRFLRNEKTLPPLTIAVNGEWGSGKSSLMNLLRCDLKSYGMRPVWFNAWHHQKEEHLLAALLQTIRLEAVPPLWNPLGFPFRARLVWYRLRRNLPLLAVLAAVLIFIVALDYQVRLQDRKDLFAWAFGQLFPWLSGASKQPISAVPIQGGFLAIVTSVVGLVKGMTALGANPAALLASVAKGKPGAKDLEEQTSFRQKFAAEFREFTRALGPRRPLVIFIDDLDRCLPENVRDVLEAVNFLVSSGDCFIVLGLDRTQVQRAIGLSFRRVAEESAPERAADPVERRWQSPAEAAEQARVQRAEFAQKYLEKLINLEVRVPQALDDATKQRLFERPPEKQPESTEEKSLGLALRFSQWAVPLAIAALLLIGAFTISTTAVPAVVSWMEQTVPMPKQPGGPGQSGAVAISIHASNQGGSSTLSTNDEKSQGEAVATTRAAPASAAGQIVRPVAGPAATITKPAVWPAPWVFAVPLYLAAVFLLMVANLVLTTRPAVVTHDSQQFTDALEEVWYPLVLAKQNTPRAAKRFVNRVRYLAMRQSGYQQAASTWERALFPDRLREPKRTTDWEPIPEPLLVALAAIEQLQPQWIYDQGAFKDMAGENGVAELAKTYPASLPNAPKLLENARAKHQETFHNANDVQKHADWNSLMTNPKYRDTFLAIWPQTLSELA